MITSGSSDFQQIVTESAGLPLAQETRNDAAHHYARLRGLDGSLEEQGCPLYKDHTTDARQSQRLEDRHGGHNER